MRAGLAYGAAAVLLFGGEWLVDGQSERRLGALDRRR